MKNRLHVIMMAVLAVAMVAAFALIVRIPSSVVEQSSMTGYRMSRQIAPIRGLVPFLS